MTAKENRRRNANRLCRDAGGVPAFSERLGKAYAYCRNILTVKDIGDKVAREIERVFDKPVGWLDIDHDAIDEKDSLTRQLTQDEADLLAGYARLSLDKKTAIWDIIDGHLRQLDPTLDKLLGPRDVRRSKAAEPRLIAAQAIERAKKSPAAKGAARKRKD